MVHSLVAFFVATFYILFQNQKMFPLGKVSTNVGWMKSLSEIILGLSEIILGLSGKLLHTQLNIVYYSSYFDLNSTYILGYFGYAYYVASRAQNYIFASILITKFIANILSIDLLFECGLT